MSNRRVALITVLGVITILVLALFAYSFLNKDVPSTNSRGKSPASAEIVQVSPVNNSELSMADFFKNTNTCTISSFSFREEKEHSPILTRALGIVYRSWTGKILGMRGTECIVELGYSDLSASDMPLRSATLECRIDSSVFQATGTNRTIGNVLTEKIASKSAADLVSALDGVLDSSKLDESEKAGLRKERDVYVSMASAVDRPGVLCTTVGFSF